MQPREQSSPSPPSPTVLILSAPFPRLVLIMVTPKGQRHLQHFEETKGKHLGIQELPGLSVMEVLA